MLNDYTADRVVLIVKSLLFRWFSGRLGHVVKSVQ